MMDTKMRILYELLIIMIIGISQMQQSCADFRFRTCTIIFYSVGRRNGGRDVRNKCGKEARSTSGKVGGWKERFTEGEGKAGRSKDGNDSREK